MVAALGLWAAEPVSAWRAQLTGPSGTVEGVLVTVENQMVFVNPAQPDLSFAIPRSDIRTVDLEGSGLVTARVAEPYNSPWGQSSAINIRLDNPAYAETFARWAGVPLNGPRTDTAEMGGQPGTVMFNVRHDDDNGRLVVTPVGIDFNDISNQSHSRRWTYTQLKGVDRKNGNEIVIRPYQGDSFKVKTTQMMDDVIYNAIADRIVAARPQ